jgi:hypothetical protein
MDSLTPPASAAGPLSYTLDELLTRSRRRQYVTKDGRFQLRRAITTEIYFWHELTKKDGKTVLGPALHGPEGTFCTTFYDKEGALTMLNTICVHYRFYPYPS